MKKIFNNIFLLIMPIILGINSTFACINDEDTVKSETLWWKTYENTSLINLITAIIIILIMIFVMIKIFNKYRKKINGLEIAQSIVISLFASTIILVMTISSWFELMIFNAMFTFIFWGFYFINFVTNVYRYINTNRNTNDKKIKRFIYLFYTIIIGIIVSLLLVLFNELFALNSIFDAILWTVWLFLIYFTWFMLLYSVFLIENYIYRIYTVSIIFIYGLIFFPSLIKFIISL